MRKLNWQRPAQHKWPTGKSAHASVLHSSCWRGSAAAAGWQHDRDLRKVTKPLLSNAYVAFFDQGNASACLPDSHKPQAGNTCSAKAGKELGGQSAHYPPSWLAKPPLGCRLARSHHSLVANTCCILGPASCMTVTRSHQVPLPTTRFACGQGSTSACLSFHQLQTGKPGKSHHTLTKHQICLASDQRSTCLPPLAHTNENPARPCPAQAGKGWVANLLTTPCPTHNSRWRSPHSTAAGVGGCTTVTRGHQNPVTQHLLRCRSNLTTSL